MSLTSYATAEQIYIPVGEAKIKQSVLAIAETKNLSGPQSSDSTRALSHTIMDLVLSDLSFTNLFRTQDPAAFLEKPEAGVTLDEFKMTDWSTIGTEFLVKSAIVDKPGKIEIEIRLFDVVSSKQIFGKQYEAERSDTRTLAHTIANDLIQSLTGKPGIFFTKLAMVCDKTGKKEIWLTDFDGTNPKQLTHHATLSFAPAWSPDNSKLAYSVYSKNAKNVKNIDLYEYDFATMKSKLLSNRRGINSGACYHPDGKSIALTMSFLGNPEIFSLDPKTLVATRITKSLGFDVDPTWSPDGKRLTFISSRSNQPMVYMANANGTEVKRITFAGKYNATPTWSPQTNRVVFASHLESHFDLFIMNPDGSKLERLTRNEGSNEDPHFSPDGNFIVFSSNRTGQKNVYMITLDGTYTKRLTFGLGNCEAPKWSRYFK